MIPRTSTINPTDMLTSVFYNEQKYVGKSGYYKGNKNYQCVNYAIGRTCEIANRAVCYYSKIDHPTTKKDIENPMMNRSGYGSAKYWLSETLWEKGSEPKVGAVMVYGSAYGNGYGHVRVVEKIDGDRLFISGGNESGKMAFKWIDAPKVTATGFLGYIYNPYLEDGNNALIKFDLDKENYDYKWSVDGNKYGDKYDITSENYFADTKLEEEGYELVLKVNGSLFYTFENAHFAIGLEKSRGVNNQDVSMSCVSNYDNCMSIACVGDELVFASQKWIINNKLEQCYGAITGMGLILGGKKRDDMHKGFESQWNTKSGRTVIGEDANGTPMSYSIEGETGKSGLTASQLQDKCLELGFHNAILLDGGGSTFRWVNGRYDISSSRKVKNALLLYRKQKNATNEDEKLKYEAVCDLLDETKAELEQIKAKYNEEKEKTNNLSIQLETLKKAVKNAIETLNKIIA